MLDHVSHNVRSYNSADDNPTLRLPLLRQTKLCAFHMTLREVSHPVVRGSCENSQRVLFGLMSQTLTERTACDAVAKTVNVCEEHE